MSVLPLPVLPRLDGGLPEPITSHKSGGRDVWSPPLEETPEDPVAATWAALGEVLDPEIPISLPELGLIYGVDFEGGVAHVRLTFTAEDLHGTTGTWTSDEESWFIERMTSRKSPWEVVREPRGVGEAAGVEGEGPVAVHVLDVEPEGIRRQ